MSFAGILHEMVDGERGVVGAALMGSDGIPIEQVEGAAAGSPEGLGDDEVAAAGVEFGRLLDEVRKAADSLVGGALHEAIFQLNRFTVLLRSVDEETFLILLLEPDANLGKARYRVRRHLLEIRELL